MFTVDPIAREYILTHGGSVVIFLKLSAGALLSG